MKGIADGAAAAGARFDGPAARPPRHRHDQRRHRDLVPRRRPRRHRHGARGQAVPRARRGRRRSARKETHCSAFAATGPATADGQVVFGHITMWNLYHAYHYNVWLDIKPAARPPRADADLSRRHHERPGLLHERPRPGRLRDHHRPDAVRHRRRSRWSTGSAARSSMPTRSTAPSRILGEGNNGLYTNEWLLADTKTNEIAMFELGTHKTKLWRSSQNEWFGGTPGFYWGCNNAKDLQVRLETVPSPRRPAGQRRLPPGRPRPDLAPALRPQEEGDRRRLRLPRLHDPAAGRLALARRQVHHHRPGPRADHLGQVRPAARPRLGAHRRPSSSRFPDMRPADRQRLDAPPRRPARRTPRRHGRRRPRRSTLARDDGHGPAETDRERSPAWHGTILPETDADTWLAAAFADYERIVALEQALKARAKDGRARGRATRTASTWPCSPRPLATWRPSPAAAGKDIPLSETRADLRSDEWYDIASGKGVLVLAELRRAAGRRARSATFMDAVRPGPRRPAGHDGRVLRGRREGPRHRPWTRLKDDLAQRRRPGEARRRRPGPPRLRPVLGGRLLRAPARCDADRLRHAGRGRRPARGRRHAPAQARRPLGQHPAYRSRPTATSPTTTSSRTTSS